MLDWFRGQVQARHKPLPAGRVISINPDDSVEWQSIKKVQLRGSHESTIKIRSVGGDGEGKATDLQIDGNLAKFLQGHNVFGIEDCTRLLYLTIKKIFSDHASLFDFIDSSEMILARVKRGDFLVNMIDVNRMYELGNDQSVEAWLHAAEMKARTRTGRACRDKGTVYCQKNSRRWAIKFYNKKREMSARGHCLPPELMNSGLDKWAEGKLRAELRMHSLELKKLGVTHGYHLNQDWIDNTFNKYVKRVDMSTQACLVDEQLLSLPRYCASSYALWRQGVSLKDMLPKNTFYRHRRSLLEHGIDITVPPANADQSNVVPLIRVLEAKPVSTPDWAKKAGLIVS